MIKDTARVLTTTLMGIGSKACGKRTKNMVKVDTHTKMARFLREATRMIRGMEVGCINIRMAH